MPLPFKPRLTHDPLEFSCRFLAVACFSISKGFWPFCQVSESNKRTSFRADLVLHFCGLNRSNYLELTSDSSCCSIAFFSEEMSAGRLIRMLTFWAAPLKNDHCVLSFVLQNLKFLQDFFKTQPIRFALLRVSSRNLRDNSLCAWSRNFFQYRTGSYFRLLISYLMNLKLP